MPEKLALLLAALGLFLGYLVFPHVAPRASASLISRHLTVIERQPSGAAILPPAVLRARVASYDI